MKPLDGRLGRAFLRFASPFADFRRLPVIGPWLRWASGKIVPRDSLTWIQVQHGGGRGIWLRLNPRTGRDYFQGRVEPEVQDAMQKYLRAGMTCYDIGANIGFFSLLAARQTGNAGRVVAFEADPEIAARLREHVARNQHSNISVVEKAAWSSSDAVFFARADADISPDRGLGHVIEHSDQKNATGTIRVEAISVDESVPMFGAPNFIKCDVEGAEVEVFQGARRLLSEQKPVILCEMHSEENRRRLLEQFEELGYRCEACGVNHVLALYPG